MEYELRWVDGEATLADAHAVRRAVFIEGQGVPESLEMDGRDGSASHVVAYIPNTTSSPPGSNPGATATEYPVGTARLRVPDPGVAKPERVAVREDHRGESLGRRLMQAIEREARDQGCTRAKLHAQAAVEEFYQGLGYETTSDVFQEAGIPHVEMVKQF